MLIVNLYGSSGVGKSTGAAYIFAKLKMAGINAEYINEFAKELVWEGRTKTLEDEIYVFAKQNHRIARVRNQVDVIVTDIPIKLCIFYNHYYGFNSSALDELIREEYQKDTNLNYLLDRVKPYNPAGRIQSEEESREMDKKIRNFLLDEKVCPRIVPGNEDGYNQILRDII